MIELVTGSSNYSMKWLTYSWQRHVSGFKEHDVFIIKYEDMLTNTYDGCIELLKYFGYSLSESELSKVIANNSFNAKKSLYQKQGDYFNNRLMRKGTQNQWKNELSTKQIETIRASFGDLMSEFGYV